MAVGAGRAGRLVEERSYHGILKRGNGKGDKSVAGHRLRIYKFTYLQGYGWMNGSEKEREGKGRKKRKCKASEAIDRRLGETR